MSHSYLDFSDSQVDYVPLKDLSEKKHHVIDVKAQPIAQTKLTLPAMLRQKKQDLRRGMALINKGIQKRKKLIYVLMFSVMAGTAVYMLYKYLKYPEFKEQADKDYFDLLQELHSQLGKLWEQLTPFQQNKDKLLDEYQTVLDAYNRAKDSFFNGVSEWQCTARGESGQAFNFKQRCDDLMYFPGEYSCQYSWEDPWDYDCLRKSYVKISDPCPDLLTSLCNQDAFRKAMEDEIGLADKLLSRHLSLIAQLQDRINNLVPDYAAFFDGCGGAAGFYSILFFFGELSPAAFIMITMLTTVFSDLLSCLPVDKQDASEAKQIADQNAVEFDGMNTRTRTRLVDAEHSIDQEYKAIKPSLDRRLAFYSCKKKIPVRRLFEGERTVVTTILGMAENIDTPAEKSMLMFGLGMRKQFSFFPEMKDAYQENPEKVLEKGKETMKHIYEFAGFLKKA